MKNVNVLINTYNNEESILTTLDSIAKQSYKDFSIIIIDDCSVDNTTDLINLFIFNNPELDITLCINETNIGYTKSFNKGLSLCVSPYICFCDGDDSYVFNKIETQINFLKNNIDVDIVGTGVNYIKGKHIYKTEIFSSRHSDILNNAVSNSIMDFCGSSIMIRRVVLLNSSGYNLFFDRVPNEDFEWVLKLSKRHIISNINSALYNYSFNINSLTRKVHYNYRARLSRQIAIKSINFVSLTNQKQYFKLLRDLKRSYYPNRDYLYFETMIEHAINKDLKNAFRDFCKIKFKLRFGVFFLTKKVILCFLIIVLPYSFLLFIKNTLKLEHASKI